MMEWINWIQIVVLAAAAFIIGLFIKNYLPSYMGKKGENLATKEDIAKITENSEKVLQEFRKDFEDFTADKKFKYNFYYEQYSKLYTQLYAIICQSEYVRHIIRLKDGRDIPFEEVPFVEISPTIRTEERVDIRVGQPVRVARSETEIETDLSRFNKQALCDHIISHGEFASQKLLKLAISYRFAFNFYSGNRENHNTDNAYADEEEFRLIGEIVECIVIEYNMLRRELRMGFIEEELASGRLRV